MGNEERAVGGVLPPAATLRFAVGRPEGPRSQTWNVVTHANTSDVYIGARAAMHRVKLSLHQRTWRLAVTDAAVARAGLPPDVDRVLQRWAPTKTVDRKTDWRLAAAIIVPSAALGEPVAEKRVKGDPIRFYPTGEPGFDRMFLIMLGAPDAGHFWLDPSAEVGRIAVAGGGQVAVWADQGPMNLDALVGMHAIKQRWIQDPPVLLPSPGFVHTKTAQGVPVLIDVGQVDPAPADGDPSG